MSRKTRIQKSEKAIELSYVRKEQLLSTSLGSVAGEMSNKNNGR